MNIKEKATKIVEILDSKKANDIVMLNVENVTVIADYFVICTGNSSTQVHALSDELLKRMSDLGENAQKIEGMNSSSWILIDFSGVIVHIFDRQARDFYALEGLWSDAEKIDLTDIIKE